MPDLKKEISVLKAENKRLKALLKNAVRLLHQSKEFLQSRGERSADGKQAARSKQGTENKRKRTAKKTANPAAS